MKNLLLAFALSTFTMQSVHAGGLSDPVVAPEVVMTPEAVAQESASGTGGYVIQLTLLVVIAMAISNN
ncbi:hypothetical protein N9L47_03330 [Rhodobacteraceae bacterium]|nr:hypothetical protein [Paracoccaceae bacterium]